MDEIKDLLTCSVGDAEYLQVINHLRMPSSIIDWNYFLQYLTKKNAEYAKERGLCEVCYQPLKEFTEMEDGMPSERYFACKNGC